MIENISTHDAQEDVRNEDILIWLNGELVHRNEAKVSVYDSGFMLGDGMWEGMRLYNGVWTFFEEHMDRLFNSLEAVSLDSGLTAEDVRALLNRTAEANGMTTDAHCRLMITRGRKAKPFQHPKGVGTVQRTQRDRAPDGSVSARGVDVHTTRLPLL